MRIAIIEDEAKLAASLAAGFQGEGYEVAVFAEGASALQQIGRRPFVYDLVVLDLMLPGMSGFEVCRTLRLEGVTLPILVLTARDATEDKVQALDSGADDFVTKPFSFEELLARIRALLRRPSKTESVKLSVANVTLDPVSRTVRRGEDTIPLTHREFDLLHYLLIRKGEAVDREEILARLWNLDDSSLGNVVDVHIRNLRKKIDDDYDPKIVQTVRGVGYTVGE